MLNVQQQFEDMTVATKSSFNDSSEDWEQGAATVSVCFPSKVRKETYRRETIVQEMSLLP